MTLHLGIEDIEPNNWVAWVFELPGCYARGTTREQALALAPPAVDELLDRLSTDDFRLSNIQPPFGFSIEEEFRAIPSAPDYLVNAFFRNDAIPLKPADIAYAACLFVLNRNALHAIISTLSDAVLDREVAGEVQQTIRGVIRHIGTAEWWYWDRLGLAFPREERPHDIAELLPKVRAYTLQKLSELIGSTIITERIGEKWSPRKLLRRAIWHERVHTHQIARYVGAFNDS
jgi:predicted RNase H-like HicB family nuclease